MIKLQRETLKDLIRAYVAMYRGTHKIVSAPTKLPNSRIWTMTLQEGKFYNK